MGSVGSAVPPGGVGAAGNGSPASLSTNLSSRLPVGFERNGGQAPDGTLFLAHTAGYTLALQKDRVAIDDGQPIDLRFRNAQATARVTGAERLPGSVNYLLGDVPSRWLLDLPTYRRVVYHGLYRGVDLAYQGTSTGIEAIWTVAPGGHLDRLKLMIRGSSRLTLDRAGALIASTSRGRFTLSAPVAYQAFGGKRRPVHVQFKLERGDQLSLRVAAYDHAVPLVVDPTVSYATNLGGSSSDFASGIAVDAGGNSYIAGSTSSPDFPVVRAVQPHEPGTSDQEDAFVAKLNPAGTALLFSTYLGGNNDEDAAAIALGRGGAVYLTGFTRSTNFPQRAPVKQQVGGCNRASNTGDAFVVKLGGHGDKLLYSTCLGGSGTDWGTGIAVDAAGHAVVTGSTGSKNFPTVLPFQPHPAGSVDAFVARLAPHGETLLYSTYLGGEGADQSSAIALGPGGSPYVVGSTTSVRFPRRSALQPELAGAGDAFIVKLAPSGRRIQSATYLGGAGADAALSVAVDGAGDTYVAGTTESTDFPTAHAFQNRSGGGTDAFVTELAPDGAHLTFSTYLGGSGSDAATALALDGARRVHVTGSTASPNFPLQRSLQSTYAGGYFYGDAFAAELSLDGQSLVYSTYLGGAGDDVGTAIAVNRTGDSFITGGTSSEDFPVRREISGGRPARGNAFVVKISDNSS